MGELRAGTIIHCHPFHQLTTAVWLRLQFEKELGQPNLKMLALAREQYVKEFVLPACERDVPKGTNIAHIETARSWLHDGGVNGSNSHRRDCHSAASPSRFIRCFNRDADGLSAK